MGDVGMTTISIIKTNKGYNVKHSQEGILATTRTKIKAQQIAKRLRKEKSQMFGYF